MKEERVKRQPRAMSRFSAAQLCRFVSAINPLAAARQRRIGNMAQVAKG